MTREEARKLFEDSKLSYKNIGSREIASLRSLISEEFKKMDTIINMKLIQGKPFKFNNDGSVINGSIRVEGKHFENREAITFNRGGFIGFSGWADAQNVKPFTSAFARWTNSIKQ